jgi:hypothetical protein
MQTPFKGWPFKTWNQGYILGVINGFMLGFVLFIALYFLDLIVKG